MHVKPEREGIEMNPLKRLPSRIMTVMVAALGTTAFVLAWLPLPFLFGPMAACLIAALLGAPLKGLGQISVAARTILGVAVGASITPALLHAAATSGGVGGAYSGLYRADRPDRRAVL